VRLTDLRPKQPGLLLAATAAACWPVWGWYAARLGDSSDDVLAVAALLLMLVLSGRRRPATPGPWAALPALLALLAYAGSYPFVPRLVSALVGFLALGFSWSLWRHGTPFRPWLVGLAVLGVPMASSLQFYGGYPLRVASGAIAVVLLRLAGQPVALQGVHLRLGEDLVLIDAPCSGVRMLWAGLLLGCCLAGLLGLRARGALLAVGMAGLLALLANGLRTAALFWIDTTGRSWPALTHELVGGAVFLAMALALLAFARSLRLEAAPCAS
jgi:exosortase/archaeosortase family protein